MEVKAAKVTGKLILNLLKKLMKEAEKLGGLEKLVNTNGNEVKLKDMVKKGQLEEIPVEEAELKELKKELNRYGVKFSVMKDKESGKYSVFFQAKDMKVMDKAFKHALYGVGCILLLLCKLYSFGLLGLFYRSTSLWFRCKWQ